MDTSLASSILFEIHLLEPIREESYHPFPVPIAKKLHRLLLGRIFDVIDRLLKLLQTEELFGGEIGELIRLLLDYVIDCHKVAGVCWGLEILRRCLGWARNGFRGNKDRAWRSECRGLGGGQCRFERRRGFQQQ